MIQKILKEPLIHFLVLGGLLFAYFQWKGGDETEGVSDTSAEIVVTKGKIQSLTEQFVKVWQRQPTPKELDGLIEEHIREEIMYREALAMGLDRDDTIVRRRMRQKLEFLSEDITEQIKPSEEQLAEFLTANPDEFRRDPVFSFRQIYLNVDERAATLDADLAALREAIESRTTDTDIASLGDRLLVGAEFYKIEQRKVASKFGRDFAAALAEAPIHEWTPPIRSGYGVHLVHISDRTEGEVPPLDEIRDAVARAWTSERREEANASFYANLRRRYTITIQPSVAADQTALGRTKEVAAK